MSRINEADSLVDLKRAKAEVRKSKSPKRNKRFKFKNCCLFLIIFFFLFIILTSGAVLAKTGIWEIPVFSRLFYRPPNPIHLVNIENPAEYANKVPTSSYDQATEIYRLELTEEDLTFMIRQNLAKQKEPIFSPNAQVVITEKEIEFFGFLLRPFKANLTLRIAPLFVDSKIIDYKLNQVKIGSLSIPPSLIDWLVKKYAQFQDDSKSNPNLFQQIRLYFEKIKGGEVTLQNGKVIIKISSDFAEFQKTTDEQTQDYVKKLQALDLNDPKILNQLKELKIDPKILKNIKEINLNDIDSSVLEQLIKLQSAQ